MKKPANPADDTRRRDLAAIHIAAKELGLDRAAYEAMLTAVARVDSAGKLDHVGRHQVLDHLGALQRRARRRQAKRRLGEPPATPNQVGLIRHIWGCLAAAGVVRRDDEAGLRLWVRRSTRRDHPGGAGYSAVQFLPERVASRVIERLKAWAARCGVDWKKA